ncbi:MAG: hypothetical protein VXW51_02105 [Pseudomonadota bacterium]|nr:hypothetical protein [Pseudomonadota bacterium]
MLNYRLKKILLIAFLPFLTSCAIKFDPSFSPTGYKLLNKDVWLKNDSFNKVFIMEEGITTTNNWNTGGNDYFIDGEFVGKLSYGLVLPYKTKKNKIELTLYNTYFIGLNGKLEDTGRNNPKLLGGRTIEIDFSKDKEQYFIVYTDMNNFSALGGGLLGFMNKMKKLKGNEPFKFRVVSKDTWWKIHDDLVVRGSSKKYSAISSYTDEDLQTARDLQGVSP